MEKRTMWAIAGFVGVVLLAVGFRFYDIQQYPPGLFPDEAANGEDVLLIFEGDARPFYPRGNGREGLFFFLQALSVKTFGTGVWQMHVPSAVIGVLTVIAVYFATLPYFGRMAATLAALFIATSHWHVTLSRTGFRAILAPLFIAVFTAAVGYVIVLVKRKQFAWSYVAAVVGGAAFAGGFYTYIAYRAMLGVLAGIVILLLLAALHPKIGFPHGRRYGKQIGVGILAIIVVLLPLGLYFWSHPEDIVGRAGQVSVFSEQLQREYGGGTLAGTLVYTTRETLRAFFAGEGDMNWRHNVAGYPLLNPLVGILMLLGVAWTIHGTVSVLWSILKGKEVHLGMIYPYILLLLFGMLLPVITTAEGIPHGLRSLGLAVPIFMLAGTAGAVIFRWLSRKLVWEQAYAGVIGVAIGLLGLVVLYDGALYFLIARNDADAHYAYRGDLTEVAAFIRSQFEADGSRPYLVLDDFSVQTVHFLNHVSAHDHTVGDEPHPDEDKHMYRLLKPELSHETALVPGELIIFTQSTMADADRYEATYPNVELVVSERNRFGNEMMRVYRLGDGSPAPAALQFDLDA